MPPPPPPPLCTFAAFSSPLPRHSPAICASAAATATHFSVEDYLVATYCVTAAQALKASKKLSHLKSLLSGADLGAVVAFYRQLLCNNADKVSRRISSLRDRFGLSDPQIGSFVLAGGAVGLRYSDIASRLEFWIPFLGSFEMLLKILKRSYRIVTANVENVIKPNIALLQECVLSVCDIVKVAGSSGWLLTFDPKQVEAFVQRADELGVPRTSGQFKYMVGTAAGCINETSATARMEFLSSTPGCSMDELCCSAVCKSPKILGLSEKNFAAR